METFIYMKTFFFNWQFINDAWSVSGKSCEENGQMSFQVLPLFRRNFQGKQQYFSHVLLSLYFRSTPPPVEEKNNTIPLEGFLPLLGCGKLGISSSLILLFLPTPYFHKVVATRHSRIFYRKYAHIFRTNCQGIANFLIENHRNFCTFVVCTCEKVN